MLASPEWLCFEPEEQLAKNDSILIDGIIAQKVADGIIGRRN
jgi:hypothetical protein